MEITDRGISRIVADATLVRPEIAEQGCLIARMIADLEGVVPTRKQLLAAAAITASARAYDDIYDTCPVDQGILKGAQVQNVLTGKGSDLILPEGLDNGIKIITDNLGQSAQSVMVALSEAQSESMRQRLPGVGISELETITRKKGSNTVLLFALNITQNLSAERYKCFEELGYLVQLVDDYLDQNQDKDCGITTLMNSEPDPQVKIIRIIQQAQKVKQLFSTNYKPSKVFDIFRFTDRLIASCGILQKNGC